LYTNSNISAFLNRTTRSTLIFVRRLDRYSYVKRVLDKDSKSPHPTFTLAKLDKQD